MSQKYLTCLDGIRAIAFLIVFVSHAGLGNVVPGGFGVTIFFFLSGYLITSLLRMEWERTGTISMKGFYLRRVCRIQPPLYAVLLVTIGLSAFGIPEHGTTLRGLLSVLFFYFNYFTLLVHSGWGLPEGLGVLWSLMVEEHFYLVFPVLYFYLRRKQVARATQVWTLLTVCGAALAWRYVLVYHFHTDLTAVPRWTFEATDARFDSILWGCIMAIAANPWCGDRVAWMEKREGLLAVGGLVMLAGSLAVRGPEFRETLRYTLQGVGLFPVFYYLVGNPASAAVRMLAWQPLRWLGWVSYTMYLIHLWACTVAWRYLPEHRGMGAVLAFGASALFAEGIRRFVETPFRRVAHVRKPVAPVLA